MSFIYDIILNFNDERLLDVYEWEKSDALYHVRKIPVFKVTSDQIFDLLSCNIIIDKELIDGIYNKCEIINNKKIKKVTYASVFTDGNNAVAINFNKLGKSVSKSYLLYDEEIEVMEFSNHLDYKKLNYQIISKCSKELLTRRELTKINELKKDLTKIYNNHDDDILKYYYYECFNNSSNDIEKIYQEFMKIINDRDEAKINIIDQINKLIKSKDRLSS